MEKFPPHVLITGATGFVGSNLVQKLDSENIPMSLVVRKKNIEKIPKLKNIQAIYETENIFEETDDWWGRVLSGVSRVAHLAWVATPGAYLDSLQNLNCLAGTLKMAKNIIQSDVEKFIGIGTCFEYNLSEAYLSIETPLSPGNLYAATKVASFHTLSQLFKKSDVAFAWARLFYLHGKGEHEARLHPYITNRLISGQTVELRNPNKIRDYINVTDAVQRLSGIILGSATGPLNVCSGQGKKIIDIANMIATELNATQLIKVVECSDRDFEPQIIVGIPN